jgi:hypothetical protein
MTDGGALIRTGKRNRLNPYPFVVPEPDTMRTQTLRPSILILAAAAFAASVAGCASGPPSEGSYLARTEKLAAECEARGGILTPSGAQTDRPQTDNVCKITGSASRMSPRT